MLELAGPAGDLAKRALGSVEKLAAGEVIDAGLGVAPAAITNMAKAIDMASSGIYKDQRGYKVLDVDGYDALAKGLGFQPSDVSRVQEADRATQGMVGVVKLRESEIAAKWAKGIAENKPDVVQEAREEIAAWNARNPATPIKIRPGDVLRRAQQMRMDRSERILKTTPKEVRAEAGRMLEAGRD